MANIFDKALNRWRALTTDDLPGGGGGGGGDASAANQTTQITLETAIRDRLPVAGTASEATLNSLLTMETTTAGRIGGTDEAAPGTDTASSGLNGRLQRIAQRLSTLIGLFPGPLARTSMLSAVTTTQSGNAVADNGRPPSFSANVSGTGAVSATIRIEARNTANGVWLTLATITLSGTTTAADGFASLTRYMEYRAVLSAISGTGAAVTVTMGS